MLCVSKVPALPPEEPNPAKSCNKKPKNPLFSQQFDEKSNKPVSNL
jgi:hypothetical protein|tara:strand:+ start:402 stop:539 length:138 start_codon:yes stop_codon:yes gene_type:complete